MSFEKKSKVVAILLCLMMSLGFVFASTLLIRGVEDASVLSVLAGLGSKCFTIRKVDTQQVYYSDSLSDGASSIP